MSIQLSSEGLQLIAEAISAGTRLELHADGPYECIECPACGIESAGRAGFHGFAEDGIRELGTITVCLNPECKPGESR